MISTQLSSDRKRSTFFDKASNLGRKKLTTFSNYGQLPAMIAALASEISKGLRRARHDNALPQRISQDSPAARARHLLALHIDLGERLIIRPDLLIHDSHLSVK